MLRKPILHNYVESHTRCSASGFFIGARPHGVTSHAILLDKNGSRSAQNPLRYCLLSLWYRCGSGQHARGYFYGESAFYGHFLRATLYIPVTSGNDGRNGPFVLCTEVIGEVDRAFLSYHHRRQPA